MTPGDNTAWGELRRREAWLWLAFWGTIPVGITAGMLLGERLLWVVMAWLALVAYRATLLFKVRCPRCGKLFFRREYYETYDYSNVFAGACLNCGLRKWSDSIA